MTTRGLLIAVGVAVLAGCASQRPSTDVGTTDPARKHDVAKLLAPNQQKAREVERGAPAEVPNPQALPATPR